MLSLRAAPLLRLLASLLACVTLSSAPLAAAQDAAELQEEEEPITTAAPEAVAVSPRAADEEIAKRLEGIFSAIPGAAGVTADVEQGVVVLRGVVEDEPQKQVLGEIARKMQDVVAVVDRVRVAEPPLLDLSASLREARDIWRRFVRSLPRIVLSLAALAVTLLATVMVARAARRRFDSRVRSPLLAHLLGNATAIPVLLLGLYVVLRIAELTGLALTVLGGTGLFGLVIGIAFRDIAENYLASILISTRRPFRTGDTIVVEGVTGVVQTVTTRGTLLVTFDGNHVLIPNSIVYKSIVTNMTTNPKIRQSFLVGIGAEESVTAAQSVAMEVLGAHEAVLDDPPPMVLVEELGSSTVNLRVYFWVDGTKHATIKVKSAAMRLVRRGLLEAGISMPAEGREVFFPREVPVRVVAEGVSPPPAQPPAPVDAPEGAAVTAGEAGLESEQPEIQAQARESALPDQGADLLRGGG